MDALGVKHMINSKEGLSLLRQLLNKQIYHLFFKSGSYYPYSEEFIFETFAGIKCFNTNDDFCFNWDLIEDDNNNLITNCIIYKTTAIDTESTYDTKPYTGFFKIHVQLFKIIRIEVFEYLRYDADSDDDEERIENNTKKDEFALLFYSADKKIFFYPHDFTESVAVVLNERGIEKKLSNIEEFELLHELKL